MISLKEALVRKNRNNNVQELVYSEVIDFLKRNYKFKLPLKYRNEIEKYIKFQDGIIDVLCDIEVSNKTITSLSNNLFTFNIITGNFDCSDCINLKSLEGAPKEMNWNFYCDNCNNLESLEGAPEKVGGSFNCSDCPNLRSLKGAPKVIKGRFIHDKI